jgi:transposase-like protein
MPAILPTHTKRQLTARVKGSGTVQAWHHIERYANNPIEADHSQLKHRLRPMRGVRTDRTAQVIIAGHAFMQNLRRGHYELATEAPAAERVAVAFTELARAI